MHILFCMMEDKKMMILFVLFVLLSPTILKQEEQNSNLT